MHGGPVPDSGPIPNPLSLCQDDINLIVTCFNAVSIIVLKTYLCLFNIIVTANNIIALWFDNN